MIKNTLRTCCENCPDMWGNVDTEVSETCIGEKTVMSVIYCEHAKVCKAYIENQEAEG